HSLFNHPATLSIYTLSLHDALPIYTWFHRVDHVGRLKPINFEEMEDEEDEEAMPSFGVGKITDFSQSQMIDFYACVECGRCTNIDRKSTRLNSSHVKISYAVFCLKK